MLPYCTAEKSFKKQNIFICILFILFNIINDIVKISEKYQSGIILECAKECAMKTKDGLLNPFITLKVAYSV